MHQTQNKYKVSYPLWVWIVFFLTEAFSIAFLVYEIYLITQGFDPDVAFIKNCIALILCFGVMVLGPLLLIPLFSQLWYKIETKKSVFEPGADIFPEDKTPDLEYVLHYMKAYNAGIALKTLGYIALSISLLGMITALIEWLKAGEFHWLKYLDVIMRLSLLPLVPLVIEKILRIRWRKRPRAEELLHNTKFFINITDEKGFLDLLNQDLEKGILYYTKDFVLTENYIFCKTLGLWDWLQFPNWANDLLVIPRIMIKEINIAMHVTTVSHYAASVGRVRRVPVVTGEWQCNLLNGKKVSFWTTGGYFVAARFKKGLQALTYYGVPVVQEKREK